MKFDRLIQIIENPPLLVLAIVLSILFVYLMDGPETIIQERREHFYRLDGIWKDSKNPKREFLSIEDEISLDPEWKEAKRKYNIYNSLAYVSVAIGIYAFFG